MTDPAPAQSPYASWHVAPLAGDASPRRYARLTAPDGKTAILMDMGSDDPAPYLAIAAHLRSLGLCPPDVLWHGSDPGLFIISDLGTQQFAQWLDRNPDDGDVLYAAAVDVLINLQSRPAPAGLVVLHPGHAAAMIAPVFEWYAPATDAAQAAQITALLQTALQAFAADADTLALRDYHAENLVWRANRLGTDRVGLLDFQDAVIAPPEYDLVSLLRDARRDVPPALRAAMTARFARGTDRPLHRVAAASAVLGVQRNLRIAGIFARLAARDGKARYLHLLPRVWDHIRDDLAHPALADLRHALHDAIPVPA